MAFKRNIWIKLLEYQKCHFVSTGFVQDCSMLPDLCCKRSCLHSFHAKNKLVPVVCSSSLLDMDFLTVTI